MLLYWVWFAELQNISLLQKHRLLEQFGDPETLYHTSDAGLKGEGISQSICRALEERNIQSAQQILRVCRERGIGILPVTDSAYPERLRNTPDAPVVLYWKGILPDWNSMPFVGVVGTRKASAYGLQAAYQLGAQIASSGGCIVSGGASGVDTAAMQGAMEADLPVVGVLGCGVDVVYPRSNRRLFETVVRRGCLLSEYPPGVAALAWHFPARNRIISGISNGTLVVEAPKKSGALITARYALEQGRDVFVVPGNINAVSCEGSNLLLQEGAIPVLSGWDVLSGYEFLYPGKLKKQRIASLYMGEIPEARVAENPVRPASQSEKQEISRKKSIDNLEKSSYSVLENDRAGLSAEEQAVLKLLTCQPQEPAELIARLELSSGKVLSVLTMLTVKGFARKHAGGRFSLK